MQRLGVSVELGLLPPQDAMFVYRDCGLRGSECYQATWAGFQWRRPEDERCWLSATQAQMALLSNDLQTGNTGLMIEQAQRGRQDETTLPSIE